eukprot:scaffold1848_cov111-Cylindrotheca_fusiformis.AAC.1
MLINKSSLLLLVVGVAQALLPAAIKNRVLAHHWKQMSDATLTDLEEVGNDSFMLHIETEDPLEYEPGHVLYLGMEGSNDDDDTKEKELIYGSYTVCRASKNTMDIMLKVVGKRSKAFAASPPGAPLKYGGSFEVPILEGIDAASTSKVVMISTGVGVGPCIGAIEEALAASRDGGGCFPPIHLFACYRNPEDIISPDHLDDLQARHAGKFAWTPVLSSNPEGRISSKDNLDQLVQSCAGIDDTHFHLIGNGLMIKEFQAGLKKAGVPKKKVTFEVFFTNEPNADKDAVDRIATSMKKMKAASSSTV